MLNIFSNYYLKFIFNFNKFLILCTFMYFYKCLVAAVGRPQLPWQWQRLGREHCQYLLTFSRGAERRPWSKNRRLPQDAAATCCRCGCNVCIVAAAAVSTVSYHSLNSNIRIYPQEIRFPPCKFCRSGCSWVMVATCNRRQDVSLSR